MLATIGVTRGLGDHNLKVHDSNIYIKPFLSCCPEVGSTLYFVLHYVLLHSVLRQIHIIYMELSLWISCLIVECPKSDVSVISRARTSHVCMLYLLQACLLSNMIVVKKNKHHIIGTVFEYLSQFNLSLILSHSLDLLIKKKEKR